MYHGCLMTCPELRGRILFPGYGMDGMACKWSLIHVQHEIARYREYIVYHDC